MAIHPATDAAAEYEELLKTWLDALLAYMLRDPAHPSLDGGIICPACQAIHGRCREAVYPLMCMARRTGESRYLDAARRLFAWSEELLCDDFSLYNDARNDWRGVTVFAFLAYIMALRFHGELLSEEERGVWEARLRAMAEWLRQNITPSAKAHINYPAANAAALALAGEFFHDEACTESARALAREVLSRVSANGLIYGEGASRDSVTSGGVRPVDICYNVEETLPALLEYARAAQDGGAMAEVLRLARAHLDFMLPDGAWDDSMGTRNFKWTYWGSRTTGGCQALFNALGKHDGVFAEAALRNLRIMKQATRGLLYGGMHYLQHGERPCVHHSISRAAALAQALDEGIAPYVPASIPSDASEQMRLYTELGCLRLSAGGWQLSVCFGDLACMKGGNASGGTVTLLWNRALGPVLAVANTDFSLKEPHNQQLTRKRSQLRNVCPRLELVLGGTVYSQAYDLNAHVSAERKGEAFVVTSVGRLCDIDHVPVEGGDFHAEYTLNGSGLTLRADIAALYARDARFVLPVILREGARFTLSGKASTDGLLTVTSLTPLSTGGLIFALSPGFEAEELWTKPDANGRIELRIE
ncbi:MAG: hypothetical protein K5663_04430 [Clostridiales bacterium]|nr:hypothetical protein [Clostridiales bacterium]